MSGAGRELTPQEVLADLLGSGDFPAEVIDEAAAEIILRRLEERWLHDCADHAGGPVMMPRHVDVFRADRVIARAIGRDLPADLLIAQPQPRKSSRSS